MFKKKSLITLVSLLMILCVTVGGTLALLVATSPTVANVFELTRVTTEVDETLDGNTKSNVKIVNTGNTDAYIRAAVVVTWQDAQGNVYGTKPVAGTDYSITFDLANGWKKGTDGFYYWNASVAPGETTGVLISTCSYIANAPAGYNLAVEIIGSGVQSRGLSSNELKPVVEAWGLDPTTLS